MTGSVSCRKQLGRMLNGPTDRIVDAPRFEKNLVREFVFEGVAGIFDILIGSFFGAEKASRGIIVCNNVI
jgi:hypothetical protein